MRLTYLCDESLKEALVGVWVSADLWQSLLCLFQQILQVEDVVSSVNKHNTLTLQLAMAD